MSILVGKNCQVLLFRVFQDFSIAWSVWLWNLYSTMTMTMVCVLDATAASICMIQKDWGWFIIWNVQQICFGFQDLSTKAGTLLKSPVKPSPLNGRNGSDFVSYFVDATQEGKGQKFSWVKYLPKKPGSKLKCLNVLSHVWNRRCLRALCYRFARNWRKWLCSPPDFFDSHFSMGSFNHVWGACFKLNVRSQSFFFAGFKTLQIQDTELSCKTGGSVLLFLFADDMICWSSLSPLCKLRHADVFHTSIHITVSLCVIKAPCLLQCHVCWTSFDAPKRTRGVQGFKDDQCDPRSPQFGTEYIKVLPDGFIN